MTTPGAEHHARRVSHLRALQAPAGVLFGTLAQVREASRLSRVQRVHRQQPSHQQVLDATAHAEATMRVQPVPVNMYEAPEALVVVAPLPAVWADDVTVELRPGTLRFWAHLRSAAPRDYLVHEWEYGGYERELDLPDGFGGGVEASLANGQLAIRVLRGECTSPLSITPQGL